MALLDTGYRTLESEYEGLLGLNPMAVDIPQEKLTAQEFRNFMYQGGADDAIATQRGLEYVLSQGMRPQEAVNLWNSALGTRFSVSDFFEKTGSAPLFSNFGQAESWVTGASAVNDPTSGMIKSETAYFQKGKESVVSDELFWNPNSPTGKELQQRITAARNRGERPGIVITPYAVFQGKATTEQLLNEVANSGADFVALDPYLGWGVPADQLYEWTKSFIPQLNALGKEVKLVTQAFAKKGQEQDTLDYNAKLLALPGVSEFVSFGLEDWFPEGSAEAKELFSEKSEWTPINADFNVPQKQAQPPQEMPKDPERKSAQNAIPSAAEQIAPSAPSAQSGVSQSIADRLMAMPRNEFETVGFQEGGKDYSMDPNGLISVRDVGAKPTDQVQVFDQGGNLLATHAVEQRSDFVQAINQAARVGIPAVIGAAILGPAGTGLLNAPAAAAVGSGGSTLLQGGSVEDALKAAALAGLGAYGAQQVTGLLNNAAYDLSFAAADAAQLANQGLNAGAIAQNLATYVDPATAISLANTAATQAFALADATQLTQQGLNPNQVAQVLESSGINANTAANIAQAAADGVTTLSASDIIPEVQFQRQTNLNQGLLSPADAERVMVTGQAFDIPGIQQLAQGVGAGVSAATVPTAPQVVTQPQTAQQVQQAQIEAQRIDPDAASSILSSVLGQPVAVAGSIQQVQVTGETPRQISQNEAAAALSSLTGQQVQVTGQTVTNQQVADTLPATAAALPQTVPVTAQTLPTTQPETMAPAATAGLLTTAPTQQVQVTSPQLDPDAASNILSSVLGQPISVAGSTQQVTVTGEAPRQISPDTAAAVLSSLVGQQVQVTGQTVTSEQAAETLPAAASTILQSVPVTGQTLQTPSLQEVAPAATAGLLAPTQTVPVTAQNIPTTAADVAPAAVAGLLTPPVQTVPVTGQNLPATQDVAGPTGAMLGTAIAPTQTVPVETRTIPTQTTAPIIPVTPTQSVSVAGNREVPTATAVIPTTAAGVTAPATSMVNNISLMDAATAAMLLGGFGSLLNQGGGGYQMDQGLAGNIINAPRPTYGRGVSGYQMPAMFQIAPTNVYNPFATVAPFGTGRFGGFSAPITLPRGLI